MTVTALATLDLACPACWDLGCRSCDPPGADRLHHGHSRRPLRSHRQYVRACRHVYREHYGAKLGEDGRLVAAGWGLLSPRSWVLWKKGGSSPALADFIDYWSLVAERPSIVGSSYNPLPEKVARAWWAGWPAHWVWALLSPDPDTGSSPAIRAWAGLDCTTLGGGRPRRLRRGSRAWVRLARAARAASRTSAGRHRLSLGALAALGRVSPEVQRATLEEAPRRGTGIADGATPLTVRDLDWSAGREADRRIHAVSDGPERARMRAAYAVGRRRGELLAAVVPGARYDLRAQIQALTGEEHGPLVRLAEFAADRALRLASYRRRGWAPHRQAEAMQPGCSLTRREATQWLREAPGRDPADWLMVGADGPSIRLTQPAYAEHPEVLAWLVALWRRDPEMPRRRHPGPGGATWSLLDRLDEVRPIDLGPGGPRGVLRRTQRRRALERAGYPPYEVLCAVPHWWPHGDGRLWLLRTPRELDDHGAEMHHCVAGAVRQVARGELLVVRIEDEHGVSTLGLAPRDGSIWQHRAAENRDAPAAHHAIARELERRMRG